MKNTIDIWKHELVDQTGSNWKNWGIFVCKDKTIAYKPASLQFECRVAPIEHFHTMLIDEKYQVQDFLLTNTDYFMVRSGIISMLMEAGRRLRQTESTVHLAVRYTDIVLNTDNKISRQILVESYKSIAQVCLNIASKFDALDLNSPFLSELQRACGVYVPYDDMVSYEREILKILKWDLKLVTIYHFVDVIKQQGFIFSSDKYTNKKEIENDLDQTVQKGNILIDYFCDLATKDYEFMQFKPSEVAAACLMASRVCLKVQRPWSAHVEEMLVYQKDEIYPAYLMIEDKYGYLIEAAEDMCAVLVQQPNNRHSNRKTSTMNDRVNRIESSIPHDTKAAQNKRKKRMEVLNNLHDYTNKFEVKPKFDTSEPSENLNPENQDNSSEGEYKYVYNDENGLAIPYDLDEDDLSYIEQTLKNQMLLGNRPGSETRRASSDPQNAADYKSKISSLLGGKTKGSTPGKENEFESPYDDSDGEMVYETGKPYYVVTENGEIVEVPPEFLMSMGKYINDENTDLWRNEVSDVKLWLEEQSQNKGALTSKISAI